MDSVPLAMDEIFEENILGEDEDQMPRMLPDLPEAEGVESIIQGTQNDETENQEVLSKLKGKGAAKQTVKRPVPKLDGMRLTGERGIPILPHIFKDVKLKGKGHEVADLKVVMRYLEHWGHRLFPCMPFDEVLARIERLGTKRDVQTCIKKIRLDMPVLGSDTVARGDDEDEVDGTNTTQTANAEEMFDALIREEEELEAEVNGSHSSNIQSETGVGGANGSSQQTQADADVASRPHSTVSTSTALSPSVLEKIERNRRLALEKRAQRLGIPVDTLLSQQGNASSQPSANAASPRPSTSGLSPKPSSSGLSSQASASGLSPQASASGLSPQESTNELSTQESASGLSPQASISGLSPSSSTSGLSPQASTSGLSAQEFISETTSPLPTMCPSPQPSANTSCQNSVTIESENADIEAKSLP